MKYLVITDLGNTYCYQEHSTIDDALETLKRHFLTYGANAGTKVYKYGPELYNKSINDKMTYSETLSWTMNLLQFNIKEN